MKAKSEEKHKNDTNQDIENLKKFKKQFNLMLNLFHDLTKDSEILQSKEVREEKIFNARNLWIDLMM